MKKSLKQLAALLVGIALLMSASAYAQDASLADQSPVDLTMLLFTGGMNPPDLDLVQSEVAEIVKAELNVNLSFRTVGFADFAQTIPLILSTGEQMDIFEPFTFYNTFLANGYLADITQYMEEYGQDILEIDGDYIAMATSGGKVYGAPSMKDLAQGNGLVMRKDLVEKYSIDLNALKTYDDLTAVLQTIKDGEGIIPLAANQAGGALYEPTVFFDSLGTNCVGLSDAENNTDVVNYYATDAYKEMVEHVYQWVETGLGESDSIDTGASLLRANRAFAYLTYTKPGIETQEALNAGVPVIVWEYTEPYATTVNVWTWCVSSSSEHPDRAVQLLNFLFTSEEINNLLAWGIEGTHYVMADAENGTIKYPEGVDANTVGYNLWTRFSLPNNFLQYVMEGNEANLWALTDEFNKDANKSKALGFSADLINVQNEITAISNVISEYATALEAGLVDPAKKLPEFLDALAAAGIDTVIEEVQQQLDAWLANH